MDIIKNRHNWTPEYRNEIRLMVRKLNGVIDSLNYKYRRSKNIAYMEHQFSYLTGLKQDLEDKILNYQERIRNHYLEIKRLETKKQEPVRHLVRYKKLSDISKSPTKLSSLLIRLNPIKLTKFYKNIENEMSCHKRDILYLKDEIKRDINHIQHINARIKNECGDLEKERAKRKEIKEAYKKQLVEEYNRLVTRLNLMCGNINLPYPFVEIKAPNTFDELPPVEHYMFNVTQEMEEIGIEQ